MSDFFYSVMEDLYGLYNVEPPKEIGLSVYFTLASKVKIGFQMEDDPHGILMMTELGRLPSGASRMLWVMEALRWNSEIGTIGILAMNKTIDTLILSHLFPINHVNGQIIYEAVNDFEQRALTWLQAMERGYPPTLPGAQEIAAASGVPGPMSVAATVSPKSRYFGPMRP